MRIDISILNCTFICLHIHIILYIFSLNARHVYDFQHTLRIYHLVWKVLSTWECVLLVLFLYRGSLQACYNTKSALICIKDAVLAFKAFLSLTPGGHSSIIPNSWINYNYFPSFLFLCPCFVFWSNHYSILVCVLLTCLLLATPVFFWNSNPW